MRAWKEVEMVSMYSALEYLVPHVHVPGIINHQSPPACRVCVCVCVADSDGLPPPPCSAEPGKRADGDRGWR